MDHSHCHAMTRFSGEAIEDDDPAPDPQAVAGLHAAYRRVGMVLAAAEHMQRRRTVQLLSEARADLRRLGHAIGADLEAGPTP